MSLLLQAYAISAIAHWDWPENWPDLFDQLIPALGSGEPNLVHGTMRVLSGVCVEGRREGSLVIQTHFHKRGKGLVNGVYKTFPTGMQLAG